MVAAHLLTKTRDFFILEYVLSFINLNQNLSHNLISICWQMRRPRERAGLFSHVLNYNSKNSFRARILTPQTLSITTHPPLYSVICCRFGSNWLYGRLVNVWAYQWSLGSDALPAFFHTSLGTGVSGALARGRTPSPRWWRWRQCPCLWPPQQCGVPFSSRVTVNLKTSRFGVYVVLGNFFNRVLIRFHGVHPDPKLFRYALNDLNFWVMRVFRDFFFQSAIIVL